MQSLTCSLKGDSDLGKREVKAVVFKGHVVKQWPNRLEIPFYTPYPVLSQPGHRDLV